MCGKIMRRVLPNFFVIGAPKAGTTTLWHLLRQHPQIFMPQVKEPWFLSHDDRYENLGWDWYEALFQPGAAAHAVGEASSCYCMTRLYPNALRRLGSHFPDARLIYCVREPCARIQSAWKQCLSTRHEMPRGFSEAVRQYPPILEGSRYGETLRLYLEAFPRDRILIVLFDDLRKEPAMTYSRCSRFLGVDPAFVPDGIDAVKNPSANKRIDTPAYRLLKATPLARLRHGTAPPVIRKLASMVLRRAMPEPVWTAELREWVRESLEDDTREFLALAGLPPNLWSSQSFAPARDGV